VLDYYNLKPEIFNRTRGMPWLNNTEFWRFCFLNNLYKYEWVGMQCEHDIWNITSVIVQFESLTENYKYRRYLRYLGIE